MKTKLLPQLDDSDITPEVDGVFTWEIDNWAGLGEKQFGPSYKLGGYTWKLYLFPEGNNAPYVSVYLAAFSEDDNATTSPQANGQGSAPPKKEWAVCAQFGIVMWNPEHPTVMNTNMAHHRFTADEGDWGFTQFFDLRKLFIPVEDNTSPLISSNKVNLTVYIRILNDPTGVLWHNMRNYNSKVATGFTGLKNQGATCYLNSLLQSLYFTTAFRHSVLQIPTDNESGSVPHALQRVFTKLHNSEQPVGTLQLTKSFGWDTGDEFTQHDVQELNRVLMDNLEGTMKGTNVEGALNKIFVGQFKSYIKCVNVDFESSRIEDYWDIQLNVKGLKNLEESFKDYVQVEMLDGENQYMATGFGLQDAKKGVVFKSFPPVLHLQLKRYDFDLITGGTVKINDRYEFPTEVDLAPYLDEDSRDPNENYEYALHGVLVHCGDLNIGHYYAFIKPSSNGPWYKFDDDKVTKATMKEVLEDNFGGDTVPDPLLRPTRPASFWRNASAYMLVYIKKTKVPEIVFDDAIPQYLLERERLEEIEEQNRRREREEQHLYMNVRVATASKQFKNYSTFDIAVFPGRNGIAQEDQPPEAVVDTYRVKRSSTISEFLDFLQKEVYKDTDRDAMRFWSLTQRPNKTYRIHEVLYNSDKSLESLLPPKGNDIDLFLEFADYDLLEEVGSYANAFEEQTDRGDRTLLFLKHFDPLQQKVVGVRSVVVYSNDLAGSLVPIINKTMGWPLNTNLRLWEEIKPFMIDNVPLDRTILESELFNGDIITFEKIESPEFYETQIPPGGFQQPSEYYDFLCLRVKIRFHHRSDPEIEKDGIFDTSSSSMEDYVIWISKKASYEQMAVKLAEHINVDPNHLQFFVVGSNGQLRGAVKRVNVTIEQMLQQNRSISHEIQYNILRMSLSEFENQKLVKFAWIPQEGILHDQRHEILIPKTSTLKEVLLQLPDRLGIDPQKLSFVTTWISVNHRIHEVVTAAFPVISLQPFHSLCISLMSAEEVEALNDPSLRENIKTVEVFSFYRDPSRAHGVPFRFTLIKGEKLSKTKARLQKMLGMYDKVFERVRIAVIRGSKHGSESNNQPDSVDSTYSNNGVSNSTGRAASIRYIVDNDAVENGLVSPSLDGADAHNESNGASHKTTSNDDLELFDVITDESLGLDRVDRDVRRNVVSERAIFIKS